MTNAALSRKIVVTSYNLSRVYAKLKAQAIAAGLLDSEGYANAIQCEDEITLTDEQHKLVQQLAQVDVTALVDDTISLLTHADQLMPQALKPYYNFTNVQKEEIWFYRQTLSRLHSYQQLSELEQQQVIAFQHKNIYLIQNSGLVLLL